MLRQSSSVLPIRANGPGLHEITDSVAEFVNEGGIREGLLTLFCRHTSASLLIQENADPEVRRDLERFFARLAPDGDELFRHTTEGDDDMPAHVRAALTQTHLAIPVAEGSPLLGTWQGVYVFEHRRAPQTRRVVLHLMGE